MHCRQCGAQNPDEAGACTSCGHALPRRCGRCGVPNDLDARFCAGCGARSRVLLEERKYVTVLFADMQGSTSLVADADPEDAAARMAPVLDIMQHAVRRLGGTVNRIEGDGIMALFGAPHAQEDHALRACCAAIEMTRAAALQSEGRIAIRVGLDSGEVLLRAVRTDVSSEYDVTGETAHLARRMETLASPNSTCLTQRTWRLVEGRVRARSLGTQTVHGLVQPMEVFALLDQQPVAESSWLPRASRGLACLRGRTEELERFSTVLTTAAELGQSSTIQIVGEPGMGKSRLMHEFAEVARARGWQVVIAAAAIQDQATSYRPLGRQLRVWLQVSERESQSEVQETLDQALRDLGFAASSEVRAGLQSLLDIPVSDANWRQLDPGERHKRIADSLAAVAVALAAKRPLLVVLEDVHWADDETLRTLGNLGGRAARAGVVQAMTCRPEIGDRLKLPHSIRFDLQPLSDHDSQQILDGLMGHDPSVAGVKARLADRSGGNPLFLEECVRALVDSGALRGEPGALRFEGSLARLELPASIQGVIAARIDRLQADQKLLLQTAAVVGRTFSLALFEAVEGASALELRERLAPLLALGFLLEEGTEEHVRYTFRHALIQETAYQSLLRARRYDIHGRVVTAIERLYAERLDEYVDELAEHALAARLWQPAARYRLRSCAAALERSASREAVAIFDRSMEAFRQMPQDRTTLKAAFDLRTLLATALISLGEHKRLVNAMEDAEQIANKLGDERRLQLVWRYGVMAHWLSGHPERALELARRMSAHASRAKDHRTLLGANFSVALVHHALGEFGQAVRVLTPLIDVCSGPLENERMGWPGYPAVFIRTFLAQCCIELGRLEHARACLEVGQALALRFDHPYSKLILDSVLAQLWIGEGRFQDVVDLLADSLATCEEHDVWTMYPVIASRRSVALVGAGDVAGAWSVIEPALAPNIYQRCGHYFWPDVFLAAAEVELARQNCEAALSLARQAEQICRNNHGRGQLAHVLETIDRLSAGTSPEAEEALGIARELGMRPLRDRLLRRIQHREGVQVS